MSTGLLHFSRFLSQLHHTLPNNFFINSKHFSCSFRSRFQCYLPGMACTAFLSHLSFIYNTAVSSLFLFSTYLICFFPISSFIILPPSCLFVHHLKMPDIFYRILHTLPIVSKTSKNGAFPIPHPEPNCFLLSL